MSNLPEWTYDEIDSLRHRYGVDPYTIGRWQVVSTPFHGSQIISEHTSLIAALRRMRHMQRGTDCVCGCYYIRPWEPRR